MTGFDPTIIGVLIIVLAGSLRRRIFKAYNLKGPLPHIIYILVVLAVVVPFMK